MIALIESLLMVTGAIILTTPVGIAIAIISKRLTRSR